MRGEQKKGGHKLLIAVVIFAIFVAGLSYFAVTYSNNLRAEGSGEVYTLEGIEVPSVGGVLGMHKECKQVTKGGDEKRMQRVFIYDQSVLSAEEAQQYLEALHEKEGFGFVSNLEGAQGAVLGKEFGDRLAIVTLGQTETGDTGVIVQVQENNVAGDSALSKTEESSSVPSENQMETDEKGE